MRKKTGWILLITSLVTLLPIAAGLILWNVLPEQMATHYGIDGTPDAYGNKLLSVLLVPLIMLVMHLIITPLCMWDQKRRGQDRKAITVILWMFPLLSCYVSGFMYAAAFGLKVGANLVLPFLGILLIVVGNYLPKCRQNPSLGIKIKWTLESEENWNATHRFAGRVWVIGGFVMMLGVFLPAVVAIAVMLASMIVLTALPIVYSYRFYRRQKADGTYKEKLVMNPKIYKRVSLISGIVVTVILIGIAVVMFTGDVTVTVGDSAVTLEATYGSAKTIAYDQIDAVEYRERHDVGSRLFGFASAKLLHGTFQNDEFGTYTRYSYTGCDAVVVLSLGDSTVVVNAKDAAGTKALYEQLATKCAKGA